MPLLLALAAPGHAFEARGGFVMVDLAVPVAPPLPVFTGDLSYLHRMAPWLSLGARYRTHLGAVHRLGPELSTAFALAHGFSIDARLFPSASLAGAWQDGIDAGGDIATTALVGIGWKTSDASAWHRLRLEGGATIEWLLWEHIAGRPAIDAAPHPAYAELAFDWRIGLSPTSWLALRAEAALPVDEDPYAPWGIYPRLTFGGGFAW